MSVLSLVVNDVKCRKYTTKKHFHKWFMRLFLNTCRLQHIWQCRHSEQENVSHFTTRFFPPIIYIASLPPYTPIPWGYAYPLMIACSLISTYSRGTEVPNAPEEGRSVNKSRAIALQVSTNSVWLLQHRQQIQFIMRESIWGKLEKRSKTPNIPR